jgi:voltage-gated potassium channel Kch
MIYIIYNALHFFVNSKKIDFNIVIASIVVYLLIALVWAEAYNLIEIASPGSFNFAVMISEAGAEHFTYFSFITITTLGYGDIIPATNLARAVSMLEAFVGQVYLVVLVARLVGMQIAQSLREPNGN